MSSPVNQYSTLLWQTVCPKTRQSRPLFHCYRRD